MPLRIAGWALRTGKAGVVAALVGVLLASHWWAYQQGRFAEQDKATEAVAEYYESVIQAERRLRESDRKRQEEQREALREIRNVEDLTGCADQRSPDGIRDRL